MSEISFQQAIARLHESLASTRPEASRSATPVDSVPQQDTPQSVGQRERHWSEIFTSVAHELRRFLTFLIESTGVPRPTESKLLELTEALAKAIAETTVRHPTDSRRGRRRIIRLLAVHAIVLSRIFGGTRDEHQYRLVITFIRYVLEGSPFIRYVLGGSLSLEESEARYLRYEEGLENAIADGDPARLGDLLEHLYRPQSQFRAWVGRLQATLATHGYTSQRHWDMIPGCYLGGALAGIVSLWLGFSPLAGFGLGFVASMLFVAGSLSSLQDGFEHDSR
jgi:hypothetical protein